MHSSKNRTGEMAQQNLSLTTYHQKNLRFDGSWWPIKNQEMAKDKEMAMKFVTPIILKNVLLFARKKDGQMKNRITMTIFDEKCHKPIPGVAYPCDFEANEPKMNTLKYIFYKPIPPGAVFTVRLTQMKRDEDAEYTLCLTGEGWGR